MAVTERRRSPVTSMFILPQDCTMAVRNNKMDDERREEEILEKRVLILVLTLKKNVKKELRHAHRISSHRIKKKHRYRSVHTLLQSETS